MRNHSPDQDYIEESSNLTKNNRYGKSQRFFCMVLLPLSMKNLTFSNCLKDKYQ